MLPVSRRLEEAFELLFEAAEQLYHERLHQGISPAAAKPLLIFDGVQDLIKDERLAAAGGPVAARQAP